MKKYFLSIVLIIGLIIFCHLTVSSQISEFQKIESHRIDSMKRALPFLKDTARVNCLNEISSKYGVFLGVTGMGEITDSMYHFALLANEEANKIRYDSGAVVSLLLLARSKQVTFQNEASGKYVRQALMLAEKIKNNQLLGRTYYLLANVENQAENYKKAIYYFEKTGDIQQETEVTTWLCMSYSKKGEYEKALPYCDKCIELAKKNVQTDTSEWGHELVQWYLFDMARIYKAAGDYESALNYLFQANNYAKEINSGWTMDISEIYCLVGKYDSAIYYWNIWKKDWSKYSRGHKALGNTILGKIYIGTNQSEKVIPLLKDDILFFRKSGKEMGNAIVQPLLLSGEAYVQKKNYSVALKYVKEAFGFAKENNARPEMMDSYKLLSNLYHRLNRNDSAYHYLLEYTALKDSIQNMQFLIKLNNYKKAAEDEKKKAQLGFLIRDNKIKQQQLKQQTVFKNFLFVLLLTLLLTGIFVFRNLNLKRKNEKLQQQQKEQQWKVKELESENRHVELQKQSAELEMQALRAQMNPHFIFNSLSSINHFILKNESKTASNYLTRFSRLIRMVLINSQKPLITLQDELEMLRIYLDMERLRVKNSFDYVISFINEIDADAVFVPPLILQPFCENALWHGLMHKEGHGSLNIDLSMENNILQCVITDDGIGRAKAAELKSKSAEREKSLGLQITTQRLALLNQNKNEQTFYTIDDILDEHKNIAGTKVILKISHQELKEELV